MPFDNDEKTFRGTIGVKNINSSFTQKNGGNNSFQNKKIGFSKMPSFSNKKNNFNTNFNGHNNNFSFQEKKQNYQDNKQNQKNQITNQFRKIDFSSFSKRPENKDNIRTQEQNFTKTSGKIENNYQQMQQFRKPTFTFQNKFQNQSGDFKKKILEKKYNNNAQKAQYNPISKDKFNNDFKKKNDNFSQKKTGYSNDFFKKSTNIKIKLHGNTKKDNDEKTFKKTSNTGKNFDKYSMSGMLKTISDNIELDTEIDDVLGNVISVKLSGINSANSLQKERKVRVSSGKNQNKVKFNKPITHEVIIYNNSIKLADLADQMAISLKQLINIFNREGITFDSQNQYDLAETIVDADTAEIIADCCGNKIKKVSDNDAENEFISTAKNSRTIIKTRPPVVTIMGHVDHGKTTLLDTIRKSSVANHEAGGITQHIGAYRTKVNDKWITFLDTPGHAAFTQMRARGAKVTDIVVIVVAADDGIMPQTEEAINHAKAANVPIIVAINKIDKPEANIEKTKQMLMQYDLLPEEFGGNVIVVPISAKDGKNIDKLLEAILLQAEILELKASYNGTPEGFVVEAKIDKKRGALATVIVKEGTLSQGDFIIVGEQYGKIKCMFDENGQMLKTAEPSVPVEILGLNTAPEAGDIFYAVKNEKEVKEILAKRQEKAKTSSQTSKSSVTIEDLMSQIKDSKQEIKTVSFIIKADTKGSLEAIVNTIKKFENQEVQIRIAHSGVGTISENDVLLAKTCNGYIMTFNTQKADKKVIEEAEKNDVEIRDYKIIYELFDDVKDIVSGKLKPVIKKTIQGHAEVKTIFEISKVGKIAGCLVKDGVVCRGINVAIVRNNAIVLETKCTSLKHGKENVKDIQSGQECGIGLENIDDVKAGDILEFFTTKEEKKSL